MKTPAQAGFSLIEVIVALGILGGGLVAVMTMFAPLARVERETGERSAAVAAAMAVNGYLRRLPFDEAAGAVGQTFLVSRSGERVGRAGGAEWLGHEDEALFSVVAFSNEAVLRDVATLPWLAFSLRVRWPVAASGETGQREVVVPGSVRR
jgi:prepilin-type N-terminal cleavage/methylation domain-containing protein